MTSIIIISVNQFKIIIVCILPTLIWNCLLIVHVCLKLFEFILCINWKSFLWCPWKLLYWYPWLVKFKFAKSRCTQKGVFLKNKLRIKLITETISANPAWDKTFNWMLQGGDYIDVRHAIWEMCKFTGIFVSALTTSDKFLCAVKNVGA